MTQDMTVLKNHLALSGGLRSSTGLLARKEQLNAQRDRNILLLDISGSMERQVTQSQRRIDILWSMVQHMRAQNVPFRMCTFSWLPEWSELVECPEPGSTTDLTEALEFIHTECPEVQQITLITDGSPDNPDTALAVAAQLRCVINVLYVGDDDASLATRMAKHFCMLLASASHGKYEANALSSDMLQLTASSNLRLMLTESTASQKGQINL